MTHPSLTLEVWRLDAIATLLLLLRRLPIIVALYKWIPAEALFCGYFGRSYWHRCCLYFYVRPLLQMTRDRCRTHDADGIIDAEYSTHCCVHGVMFDHDP